MTKQIIAKFYAQAWVNDYAIDVDPEGETEWNVTDDIIALGKEAALNIKDNRDESDNLRYSEKAPQWVKEWRGPFYITVENSIGDYFGENLITDHDAMIAIHSLLDVRHWNAETLDQIAEIVRYAGFEIRDIPDGDM